jgi:hypothetical protein
MDNPTDQKKAESLAYSDELRELIIKAHQTEILACALAIMEMLQARFDLHVDEKKFLEVLVAASSGTFVVGFKKGNDYFLEDADKEKA